MSVRDHLLEQPTHAAIGRSTLRRVGVLRRVGTLAAGISAVLIVLILAFYNLETYPRTWFDEGSHLHVPKTLVQYGVYADISAEGFRYFGPTTGVGPTVMLPVALVFKLAGIGLVQARLVMVAFLLATIALFAAAARHRYGAAVAGLATALLITSPGVNLLYLGRQVLGEVPALGFLVLGLLLWWRSLDRGRHATMQLVLASLALGLAALTKSLFGVLLVPTFVLLLAADRLYYRQAGWRWLLAPLAGVVGAVGLSYFGQLLIASAGAGDLLGTMSLLRDASSGAIFVFSPSRTLASLRFLASPEVFGYWALPALVYGALLARDRSLDGLRQASLVAFAGVGLSWFTFGSIGWPRYAFPALAICALLVAKLLVDLIVALRQAGPAWASRAQGATVALGLGALVLVGYPLQDQLRTIVTATDRSPQQVAAFLQSEVPVNAIVETWEPELGFLSDHRFHYPPLGWLDRAVRARWLQPDAATLSGYDLGAELDPAYLVVGPFGKYTGIYASSITRPTSRRMTSIGEYDVYRLR